MTQLLIMIALLAGLAFGNATHSSVNPVEHSRSADSISPDKVGKVEPPQQKLGGGEGGYPGF